MLGMLGIVILVFIGFVLYRRNQMIKYFNKQMAEFNHNRINPLSKEAYYDFFKLEHTPINFLGMGCISIKDANHRDGDELVTNLNRDAKARIKDHLKLSHAPKSSIISLGYNFKDKNNLITFIALLKEVVPSGSQLSFPVNKEWFVFQKTDESIGVSFKP